jgi:phospholipid/cholesterol/gamma-HCH transport system substrate-binding protein
VQKKPPTIGQIIIAIGFALSCFGLLLFLWLTFGGPVPLGPEGYRIKVPFKEATTLAAESDVRISGVSVGKVKAVELGTDDTADNAVATIEVDAAYAPIPEDTRATLRQKTLLGETYVELTPGNDDSGTIAEGGQLPEAQVAESVQLDEIFRSFDEETRASFQTWMQDQSLSVIGGRGYDLNAALGNLDPFAEETNDVLRVLDSQRLATRQLVRDTGIVFDALSERQGQLRGLIENTNEVFQTTARRDNELAQTFTILPTFLEESRLTLERLDRFSSDTNPLVTQLRPAARELSPTLVDLGEAAPGLERFFDGLGPVIDASKRGLPATERLLEEDLPPLLAEVNPWFRQFNSLLQVVANYRREITALLGNATAATQAVTSLPDGSAPHYLRTLTTLNPETAAAYPRPLQWRRNNPYLKPGGYNDLATHLPVFDSTYCSTGLNAFLDPADANDPDLPNRDASAPTAFFDRYVKYAFAGRLAASEVPQTACEQQGEFSSIGEPPREETDFQHVRPQQP